MQSGRFAAEEEAAGDRIGGAAGWGRQRAAGIMGAVMACPVAAARKLPGKRLGPSRSLRPQLPLPGAWAAPVGTDAEVGFSLRCPAASRVASQNRMIRHADRKAQLARGRCCTD